MIVNRVTSPMENTIMDVRVILGRNAHRGILVHTDTPRQFSYQLGRKFPFPCHVCGKSSSIMLEPVHKILISKFHITMRIA